MKARAVVYSAMIVELDPLPDLFRDLHNLPMFPCPFTGENDLSAILGFKLRIHQTPFCTFPNDFIKIGHVRRQNLSSRRCMTARGVYAELVTQLRGQEVAVLEFLKHG